MTGVTPILIAAGLMLAVGLLTVLAWFIYSSYLDYVERRLERRKGLYRELVSELATRDRALLEPTIHQMSSLYDLDALEAVLEEQARTATGRPEWLLEVYDQLGLVDKYIDKLRNARKWRDRAFAAELLGRVGSAKAVPALLETVQATQREDSDVREIALRALARIADPAAVHPLVEALANAESWLAPRIADILSRHGEVVTEPLVELLSDSGRNHSRAWAANVLGEVQAARAFPVLIRGLDDPDAEVRAKSASALGRLADRRAVTPLLEHLLSDPAPFVRVRIASALGRFEGPEVVNRLVRALGDPAWWVRMRGVEALEQIGSVAQGSLLIALDDPDAVIRQRAAVSLERMGLPAELVRLIESGDRATEASQTLVKLAGSSTRELLTELLHHPSPRVREVVLSAIRQSGREDLTPELVEVASREPEASLRAIALDTLRISRVSQALPVALVALSDSDRTVRAAAVGLVAETGGPEVVDALRSHTMDQEPSVRAAAARALGAIRATSAEPEFRRLLDDEEPLVREAAVVATGEAGLDALTPDLMELFGDPSERVRQAAARAVATLGDRSTLPALLRAYAGATPDLRDAITLAASRLDAAALSEFVESLVEGGDTATKVGVARTLGRLRRPDSVPLLARLAKDSAAEVRAAALQAVGRCARSQETAGLPETLAAGLSDPDAAVRANSVDVSSRVAWVPQTPDLATLLQDDPDARVRERAALAVGLLRLPAGEEALVAACRRAEPANVRAAATLAAGVFLRDSLVPLIMEMPDQAAVRELLRARLKQDAWFRLLRRQLPSTRALELGALAAPATESAPASLAVGMQRMLDAGDRVRLISGLQAFQGEPSRAALLDVIRGDPSAEVRTAALSAVAGLLDPDELLALGSRTLGDPSLMVRRAAVGLFARVPPSRAYPRLIQALRQDDDPAVLAEAAGLAEEHFGEFQAAVLTGPLPEDRTILMVRLSRYIHHPELSGVLASLARNPSPAVRHEVAEVWNHRPDAAEPVALEALTSDPVIGVRRTATGAAAAAARYDLLDAMIQDPDVAVRRDVGLALARFAPVGRAGLVVLERLKGDSDMVVRAAAYVAHLLQGVPVPLPPDLDPRVAAEAVREAGNVTLLRSVARTASSEDRRLAAALALALLQDEVAREVARTDPAPAIRHRVGGALELTLPQLASGESV